MERDALVASLDKLITGNKRSALALCQTMRHMKTILLSLCNADDGFVRKMGCSDNLFEINPAALRYNYGRSDGVTCSTKIVLILYEAGAFRKKTRKINESEDDQESGEFADELHQALNTTDHKVLLWSAYKSASRGINFLLRHHDVTNFLESKVTNYAAYRHSCC
jgi:hypothetical protein